jgi:hypothetical protein
MDSTDRKKERRGNSKKTIKKITKESKENKKD